MRARWPLALLAAAAVVIVGGAALAGSGAADRRAGRLAPALPSSVLVGPPLTIAALHGRPAAINFWASWCDPCRREAPELARLAARLGDRATLVGVDWNDNASDARSFLRSYQWTFTNLGDADGLVGNRFGLQGLPTTFILDADGRVRTVLTGPQRARDIEHALAPLTHGTV